MPRRDATIYINAKMNSLSEKARPGITALYRALREAAEHTGLNAYQVGNIMTYFMQSIAQQVAIGKLVRIPGFGVFGAKVYRNGRRGTEPLYCYPDFVAAIPFRNDVALFAPMSGANDRFLNARKKRQLSEQRDITKRQERHVQTRPTSCDRFQTGEAGS